MSIEFDVRADLDDRVRQSLTQDLRSFLGHHRRLGDDPRRVIISRPSADPKDERIVAVIRSESGKFLGSITGEANGTGTLIFSPPG